MKYQIRHKLPACAMALFCCAFGFINVEAQTRTEVGGGQKIVYPGLYGPAVGGGGFYNPKPFEPRVNDGFVYMIVQGTPHHYNYPLVPSDNCLGDELFLYKATRANNGFLFAESPPGQPHRGFAPVARISPCAEPGIEGNGPPNIVDARGFVAGNVLFSSQEQEYLMVATAAVPLSVSSTGNEEFVEIMLGRTVNQQLDTWTWHTLFKIEQGLFGIAGTYLAPDQSRPPLAGHEYLRGYYRLLKGLSNHAAEIRIDISDAWCGTPYSVSQYSPVSESGGPCSKVEIRKNGAWQAVQNGQVTESDVGRAGPDRKLSSFAPWGLSKVGNRLELWGTRFSNVSTPDPSCGPAASWPVQQESTFEYHEISSSWSLGAANEVDSLLRCMPGNTRIARSFPWVFQPKRSGRRFLYSVTNDDNRTTASGEFDGAYIIVTALEDR